MKQPLIIGVDPSILQAGVGAVFHSAGDWQMYRMTQLSAKASASENGWHRRAHDMAVEVASTVAQISSHSLVGAIVVVESPNNWFTGKGMSSKDSEAVQKLYYVAGAITARIMQISGVLQVYTCSPADWKGQTSKEIIRQRYVAWMAGQGFKGGSKIGPERMDSIEALMLAREGGRRVVTNEKGTMTHLKDWNLIWDVAGSNDSTTQSESYH